MDVQTPTRYTSYGGSTESAIKGFSGAFEQEFGKRIAFAGFPLKIRLRKSI